MVLVPNVKIRNVVLWLVLSLGLSWLNDASAAWEDRNEDLRFTSQNYELRIVKKGFRFTIQRPNGSSAVNPHRDAGLAFRGVEGGRFSPASSTKLLRRQDHSALVEIACEDGSRIRMRITAGDSFVRFAVDPSQDIQRPAEQKGSTCDVDLRFSGNMNPAFGLGDQGGWTDSANVYGYHDLLFQHQHPRHAYYRFISTFSLFPKQRLGQVVFSRDRKYVQIDDEATALGVRGARRPASWYWFVGDAPQVYAAYKAAREREGFGDRQPRYTMFGVGFEGYGAQSWNTSQATVESVIQEYLDRGYPLKWAVISSGRWRNPRRQDPLKPEGNGTSFGLWGERYPDPEGFKRFLRERDIQWITGTRQNFVALPQDGGKYDPGTHGPFPRVGVKRGYFVKDKNGKARTFRVFFPRGPVYLLDPDNPKAIEWFVKQAGLWGSQGFKEDLMFIAPKNDYYDDGKHNPLDAALYDAGYLMIVRCSAYGVPGSILRMNDSSLRYPARDQDRIPINLLCLAASGQANVYPDIVGGTPIRKWNKRANRYVTRMAMLAAVCPAMSFGNPPWKMKDAALEAATLKAAQWHETYRPYIFSAAIESYRTGYPRTFTPLPVAYPDDDVTYDLASVAKRQYSWLLGPSLLACPLFGHDFNVAEARDVYLPAGKWQDFESGRQYEGPVTLPNYALPMNKMPLFVGRTGVLVSQDRDGQIWGELFPSVMDGSSYTYAYRDGQTQSRLIVDTISFPVVNAHEIEKRLTICEKGNGRSVVFKKNALPKSFRFRIEPGKDYRIGLR